jgi:polyphosphate kinase
MLLLKFENDESICCFAFRGWKQYIILIDDVIRHNLKSIFNIFDYESVSSYDKISRDAQLDIDSDLSKSMLEKISTSVKDRIIGACSFYIRQDDWKRHLRVLPW